MLIAEFWTAYLIIASKLILQLRNMIIQASIDGNQNNFLNIIYIDVFHHNEIYLYKSLNTFRLWEVAFNGSFSSPILPLLSAPSSLSWLLSPFSGSCLLPAFLFQLLCSFTSSISIFSWEFLFQDIQNYSKENNLTMNSYLVNLRDI